MKGQVGGKGSKCQELEGQGPLYSDPGDNLSWRGSRYKERPTRKRMRLWLGGPSKAQTVAWMVLGALTDKAGLSEYSIRAELRSAMAKLCPQPGGVASKLR